MRRSDWHVREIYQNWTGRHTAHDVESRGQRTRQRRTADANRRSCAWWDRSTVPRNTFREIRAVNWLVPWHQDTALPLATRFDDPEWVSWSENAGVCYAHAPWWALSRVVALRVHLDASTIENGPLRVVPGSHQVGVLTDQGVRDYVKTNDHHACLVPRGGVLAMCPLLIHSSSKAQTDAPRRVLHIEYADTLDLKLGIRLAVA